MKKTILITGSTGCVGMNLIEQLDRKKYNLLTPKHKELDLLDDSAASKYFKKNKIDVVVNCALIGGSRDEEYANNMVSINLKMFFNIARNKKYFKKMIHIGSGAEYNKSRPLIKVKEEEFDKMIPKDDYGFFKYICSKYIESTDNIICLRIFGLYGKYEDYKLKFVSESICKNILGLPIIINKNVYFDYVYMNDFIKIIEYFINNSAKYKFYNVGKGKKINILTIAKSVNKIADKKSEIIVKNKGLNNEYTCDNSRLMKEIKNFKFTDFDQSLKEFYLWYKSIKSTLEF